MTLDEVRSRLLTIFGSPNTEILPHFGYNTEPFFKYRSSWVYKDVVSFEVQHTAKGFEITRFKPDMWAGHDFDPHRLESYLTVLRTFKERAYTFQRTLQGGTCEEDFPVNETSRLLTLMEDLFYETRHHSVKWPEPDVSNFEDHPLYRDLDIDLIMDRIKEAGYINMCPTDFNTLNSGIMMNAKDISFWYIAVLNNWNEEDDDALYIPLSEVLKK
jgi:hypothetical protein